MQAVVRHNCVTVTKAFVRALIAPMGGVKRVERLWDLVKHGSLLRVICANPNCGRVSIFDPAALRDFLGASPMIDQMKFRCERCGGTAIWWDAVQATARAAMRLPPGPIEADVALRRKPEPEPDGPPSTLASIRRETSWVHWYCDAHGCGFHTPLALAPYIMIWGAQASADMLRNSLGCPLCHAPGGVIRHPSWGDSAIGWQPYPTEIPTIAPVIHAVPRNRR